MAARKKTVLATVAALAGVSSPTVSKVINGRDDVAADTRVRVQAALDELGYQSPAQRRVVSHGPVMVDLVVNGLNSQYGHEVMSGLLDHAANAGIEVVVSNMTPRKLQQANHEEWAQRMLESGRKGLILATSAIGDDQLEPYTRRTIPVVVIDPVGTPQAGCVTVRGTNWAGGKSATEHLIELGHRRIGIVGGPEGTENAMARLHGYLAALRGHGIEARPEYITAGEYGPEAGVEGARKMLALPEPPTAIFAANDFTALGVLEEAHRQGVRVPEDLSLVGFDGLPMTENTLPRLTSVAQPLKDMGRSALRSILALVEGQRLDSQHIELATELVLRDSTMAPRN